MNLVKIKKLERHLSINFNRLPKKLQDDLKLDNGQGVENSLKQSYNIISQLKTWEGKSKLFKNYRENIHCFRFLIYYVFCQIVIISKFIVDTQLQAIKKQKSLDADSQQFLELEMDDRHLVKDIGLVLQNAKKLLGQIENICIEASKKELFSKTNFFQKRQDEVYLVIEMLSYPINDINFFDVEKKIEHFLDHCNRGGVLSVKSSTNKHNTWDHTTMICTKDLIGTDAIDVNNKCISRGRDGATTSDHYQKCLRESNLHQLKLLGCLLMKGINRHINPPIGPDLHKLLRLNKDPLVQEWGQKILKLHQKWKIKLNSTKKNKKHRQTKKKIDNSSIQKSASSLIVQINRLK